jgi:hypothetical protein
MTRGLKTSETFSDTSGFGLSVAIPVGIILKLKYHEMVI